MEKTFITPITPEQRELLPNKTIEIVEWMLENEANIKDAANEFYKNDGWREQNNIQQHLCIARGLKKGLGNGEEKHIGIIIRPLSKNDPVRIMETEEEWKVYRNNQKKREFHLDEERDLASGKIGKEYPQLIPFLLRETADRLIAIAGEQEKLLKSQK